MCRPGEIISDLVATVRNLHDVVEQRAWVRLASNPVSCKHEVFPPQGWKKKCSLEAHRLLHLGRRSDFLNLAVLVAALDRV